MPNGRKPPLVRGRILCYNLSMKTILHYSISASDAGRTVASFLCGQGYSSRLVVKLRNTADSFYINDAPVFSTRILTEGDRLTVILTEQKASDTIEPVPMDIRIVYEDAHLMVVDKPAGVPVHPSQGNHGNTLANGIAWYQKSRGDDFVFRAVNRLDKDTSGLLLLAKNQLSSCILSARAAGHEIRREYAAIVLGKTGDAGTISVPIARKPGSVLERIPDLENGDQAVTHYRTLAYRKDADLSLVRLLLETGRTHQIRVHMKSIGHPLPGDFLYCPDYRYIDRQPLHSASLCFLHPISQKPMEFFSPLPEDMRRLFPEYEMQASEDPSAYGRLNPFG